MKNQRQKQKDFLTTVLGGPNVYKGKDMREAHKHMKLENKDFDVIVELILQTLRELGVGQGWINKIEKILESTRADCLNLKVQPSIFERLGGAEAIDVAVESFYDKVLSDRRVKHFFTNTNMKNQR